MEDYARRGHEPKDEVQVYTWPDATLRELTDLVKEVQPAARRSTARLDFALVYPDKKGRNVMRVVRFTCLYLRKICATWMEMLQGSFTAVCAVSSGGRHALNKTRSR